MDCLSICMMLKLGLKICRLRELLEPMIGQCCRHKLGHDVYLLQIAHSTCHHSKPFAQMVSKELDIQFANCVSQVKIWDAEVILHKAHPEKLPATSDQIGMAWALLTDRDAKKQGIGHFLIHALFVRMERGGLALKPSIRQVHLEHQCKGLLQQIEEKQREIDDMLSYIHKTRYRTEMETAQTKL